MMILVNAPTGVQEVVEVGEGGGYFDVARVLWDERVDGDLPAITLGGMKRVNGKLVFDAALLDSHNTAKAKMDTAKTNADLKTQISDLDQKRIRPLAEGDAVFLAKLNDKIKALRAKLV